MRGNMVAGGVGGLSALLLLRGLERSCGCAGWNVSWSGPWSLTCTSCRCFYPSSPLKQVHVMGCRCVSKGHPRRPKRRWLFLVYRVVASKAFWFCWLEPELKVKGGAEGGAGGSDFLSEETGTSRAAPADRAAFPPASLSRAFPVPAVAVLSQRL